MYKSSYKLVQDVPTTKLSEGIMPQTNKRISDTVKHSIALYPVNMANRLLHASRSAQQKAWNNQNI